MSKMSLSDTLERPKTLPITKETVIVQKLRFHSRLSEVGDKEQLTRKMVYCRTWMA